MAVELEIRDGSPYWASPDIFVLANTNDEEESMPVAGMPCYLKARVRNNGSTAVANATVRFYWANPAIGLTRDTATLVGQAFVSLEPGDEREALCLTPWVPEFLNEGHECVLAEAFHETDPIMPSTDFEVPTDRHVAQRNLSVAVASMSGMFHFNFEMHNGSRKDQALQAMVQPLPFDKLRKRFPQLVRQHKLDGLKEGKLVKSAFTDSSCLAPGFEDQGQQSQTYKLQGHGKAKMALTGQIDGDFAALNILQLRGKSLTGGLCVLIINSK